MRIKVPTRGNRCLEGFLDAANADEQLKAWWHVAQVNATRCGMSDHSWIHIQIVINIALRLFRLLNRRGVEPDIVRDPRDAPADAEVVIAAGCLLHDVGMSIHRTDHEAYSLFLAADKLGDLLARRLRRARAIGDRGRGDARDDRPPPPRRPVHDRGRDRARRRRARHGGRAARASRSSPGRPNIHSLSAAAIEEVKIEPGEDKAVRIEIDMNNSAGIFQVDELLATKLRGSGLEEHIEVVARIDAEHEKRLVPVFRI